MTKFFITLSLVIMSLLPKTLSAQFEPQSDVRMMFTAGIGASYWGLPLFAKLEAPIKENITIGGSVSYQTNNERYTSYRWRHTIIGIHVRGNYHFNTLLELPDEWDLYSGASAGYYIWNTAYRGDFGTINYNGAGAGGVSIGFHAGGRYFVNEKLGVELEVGGGNVLSGATVGATFLL